jgi:hypothetical protein
MRRMMLAFAPSHRGRPPNASSHQSGASIRPSPGNRYLT